MTRSEKYAEANEHLKRPVPDDFATIAPTMFQDDIAKHYSAGTKTVAKWIKLSGVKAKSRAKPLPADFRDRAIGKTFTQINAIYQVNERTLQRWLREADVVPVKHRPNRQAGTPHKAAIPTLGSMDMASTAAQHLMRRYASVYSAKILEPHQRKAKNLQPTDWFVAGKGFMPVEQMIGMAREHGWGA